MTVFENVHTGTIRTSTSYDKNRFYLKNTYSHFIMRVSNSIIDNLEVVYKILTRKLLTRMGEMRAALLTASLTAILRCLG